MIDDRTVRVAVVGAGPAGFYTASHLLDQAVAVDVFDRLPTPFGLVRAGVAPDHPKIKSVNRVFEKIARRPGFRFFGNVEVGRDIGCGELARWYDAVVYSIGAERGRRAGLVGELLPGNHSATEFVGWYNGRPQHRDLSVDLSGTRAVVIGNGNVALDVARVLACRADRFVTTDMADHALQALSHSRIREVVVLGRRGPAQASFTTLELIDLSELPDVDVVVDPADLADAETGEGIVGSNLEILRELAGRQPSGRARRIVFRFCSAPLACYGGDRVRGLEVARTELVRVGDRVLSRRTPDTELLPAGLVVHAIGYAGQGLPELPFDPDRGTIPHNGGRVREDGGVLPGHYVAGWIKRGPSGVIGTNRLCAKETAEALLADARAGLLSRADTLAPESVSAILARRVPGLVDYRGWTAIDAHEQACGSHWGRPRVKFTRVADMLRAAGASPIRRSAHQ
ncbi:FAD-dependent oxidoreductase [Nocardia crassostreae]|uniref:FAD-dependent oxidoreductase n=1 Tax=Nocardia crassostreae TaxID=53428 RepID=UPI0008339428